jgi:hypothetical protein
MLQAGNLQASGALQATILEALQAKILEALQAGRSEPRRLPQVHRILPQVGIGV